MLAAFSLVDRLHAVPVVGRGDYDRVNIFSLEYISVVAIRRHAGPGGHNGLGKPILIHVANRRNRNLALVHTVLHIIEMVSPHTADTYVGRYYALVGAGTISLGQYVRRNKIRDACCSTGGGKEFSSAEFVYRFHNSYHLSVSVGRWRLRCSIASLNCKSGIAADSLGQCLDGCLLRWDELDALIPADLFAALAN